MPYVGSIRLPGTDKPLYSNENGLAQADFDLGRVNQTDHRDVPPFRLRAAPPGEYEIEWQITATGLSRPIRGTVKIKVEPPQAGEAILTLGEAEAERRDYELH